MGNGKWSENPNEGGTATTQSSTEVLVSTTSSTPEATGLSEEEEEI